MVGGGAYDTHIPRETTTTCAVFLPFSFQMRRLKRDLWWPSRILVSISTTISSLIFLCYTFPHYHDHCFSGGWVCLEMRFTWWTLGSYLFGNGLQCTQLVSHKTLSGICGFTIILNQLLFLYLRMEHKADYVHLLQTNFELSSCSHYLSSCFISFLDTSSSSFVCLCYFSSCNFSSYVH